MIKLQCQHTIWNMIQLDEIKLNKIKWIKIK